jgi:hypothetical protein
MDGGGSSRPISDRAHTQQSSSPVFLRKRTRIHRRIALNSFAARWSVLRLLQSSTSAAAAIAANINVQSR